MTSRERAYCLTTDVVFAHDVTFRNRVERVICPLAMHVGTDGFKERSHRWFGKDDDVVDEAEGGQQLRAIGR